MTEENEEHGYLPPEDVEDTFKGPIHEPVLTQLDEASRRILLDSIYEYGWIKGEDGKLIRTRTKTVYPDLEKALCYAASHLNSVMNYTRTQALSEIMYWNGLFYRPLFLAYEDDMEALLVLNILDSVLRRSIMGGSMGGTHQNYNVKMAGAHRILEQSAGKSEPR